MIERLYYGIARRLRRFKNDWRKPAIEGLLNVPVVRPVVRGTLPHDQSAFTQGLAYSNGCLYESAGLYGKSSLRKMNPNGTILKKIELPDIFAEDIAVWGDELVLLTLTENKALRFSLPGLEERGHFSYWGRGWGLANDRDNFIMSDGYGALFVRDRNFRTVKKLRVRMGGLKPDWLNALEYLDGKIYANVLGADFILEIDSATGTTLRIIDCRELRDIEKPDDPRKILNGIAYCNDGDFFYLTGKNWKNIFRVKFP